MKPDSVTKGDLSVAMKIDTCGDGYIVKCVTGISVLYTENEESTMVELSGESLFINNVQNNEGYYSNDYVYVRRSTTMFWVVSGPSFEVMYDQNGRIYVRLFPIFMNQVS